MIQNLHKPARGWWEKDRIEAEIRAACTFHSIDHSVVGKASLGRDNGRPVWIIPIDLSGEHGAQIHLALF